MNLFDALVRHAMETRPDLAVLKAVVEKELLHHDILREMSAAGLLADLTLIGGTCLRACYGAPRLSEDLDFAGGRDFSRATLKTLADILEDRLEAKYGLEVSVAEPRKESAGVDTWRLTMVTRPERKDLPAQRIHIDICAVPSHDPRPMMLRNSYGIDMGTSGLILQAQSREEILADKMIALAFRPNRIKNRDLWDIGWLKQQGIELPAALIPKKIEDHRRSAKEFTFLLRARTAHLRDGAAARTAFLHEIRRFLPVQMVAETAEKETYWAYLSEVIRGEGAIAIKAAR